MKYHIRRGDQDFGPYTLDDLRRYMAQGNIVASDLARAEGTQEWARVDQIVGSLGVPADTAGFALAGEPVPQGLHWGLVLLLSVVTCGIFGLIWMFVEAVYATRLGPGCRAPLFYGLHVAGFMAGQVLLVSGDTGMLALGGLLILASFVPVMAGHYSIQQALEKHLGLQLSGSMVLFFNVLYFQYHLSAVRERMLQPRA